MAGARLVNNTKIFGESEPGVLQKFGNEYDEIDINLLQQNSFVRVKKLWTMRRV